MPLSAYWNNGVWVQSANEDFKVHFGGRIQFDAFNTFRPSHDAAVDFVDKGTPFEDAQGFRRDRIRVEGTIYDSVDFVWEYDFATAQNSKNIAAGNSAGNGPGNPNSLSVFTGTGITDMNCTLKHVPLVQNVSVGSFLVPFSFELGTSDRWMDFIERSCAFDSFVPATNFANYTLGAKTFGWNEDETWTYAASVSLNNMWDGAFGFDYGNDYMFTGRTTILPYYACEGRKLIEVGVSGCFQKCQEDPLNGNVDSTQLRSRFASREYLSPLTQSAVDTGLLGAERQNTIGAELIAQDGPLSWESEYYGSWVLGTSGTPGALGAENLYFFGYYTQVGYFLTGENRNYNRDKADYERVVPYENWFRAPGDYNCCTGLGAVQVCARYSYVSLDNGNVHGGQEDEYTFGFNWFLNPNLKFQTDYSYTSYSDRATSGTFPFSHGTVGGSAPVWTWISNPHKKPWITRKEEITHVANVDPFDRRGPGGKLVVAGRRKRLQCRAGLCRRCLSRRLLLPPLRLPRRAVPGLPSLLWHQDRHQVQSTAACAKTSASPAGAARRWKAFSCTSAAMKASAVAPAAARAAAKAVTAVAAKAAITAASARSTSW